jgi:hypothetical protein
MHTYAFELERPTDYLIHFVRHELDQKAQRGTVTAQEARMCHNDNLLDTCSRLR